MVRLNINEADACKVLSLSFVRREEFVPCPKYGKERVFVYEIDETKPPKIGLSKSNIDRSLRVDLCSLLQKIGAKYVIPNEKGFTRPESGFSDRFDIRIMSGDEPEYNKLKQPELDYQSAVQKAKEARRVLASKAVKINAVPTTYSDYYYIVELDGHGVFACPQPKTLNKDGEWLSQFLRIGHKYNLCALQGTSKVPFVGSEYKHYDYTGVVYIPQNEIDKAVSSLTQYQIEVFNALALRS